MQSNIVAAFGAVFLCVLMAGCAALQYGANNPATARLVTDQITARFISEADDPKDRAAAVRDVVGTLRAEVDTNAQATLASIEQRVRDEIDWDELAIADRQILEFALLKARQSLSDLIGDGLLDPDERATIGTLLDWIDAAAERVQAR